MIEDISEEGIEACNKHIRRCREHSSRKISFKYNVMDIFIRLLSQSYSGLVIHSKFQKETLKQIKTNSELPGVFGDSLIIDEEFD